MGTLQPAGQPRGFPDCEVYVMEQTTPRGPRYWAEVWAEGRLIQRLGMKASHAEAREAAEAWVATR